MIFQNKPAAILYLRRQDAVLITHKATARVNIPLEVFHNLEVRDTATLTEIIAHSLDEHKIRGHNVLIVLDTAVVFQKEISAKADTQAALKDFDSKVPFDPETKQLLTVRQKDQLYFYGANKILHNAVGAAIRKANKLRGIVPAFAYGVQDGKKIDKSTVTSFFQDLRPIREANFLTKV